MDSFRHLFLPEYKSATEHWRHSKFVVFRLSNIIIENYTYYVLNAEGKMKKKMNECSVPTKFMAHTEQTISIWWSIFSSLNEIFISDQCIKLLERNTLLIFSHFFAFCRFFGALCKMENGIIPHKIQSIYNAEIYAYIITICVLLTLSKRYYLKMYTLLPSISLSLSRIIPWCALYNVHSTIRAEIVKRCTILCCVHQNNSAISDIDIHIETHLSWLKIDFASDRFVFTWLLSKKKKAEKGVNLYEMIKIKSTIKWK